MLSTWLDAQKGRAKVLVEVLGCAHSYISQIKSATRPCTKARFEEICRAMQLVEAREKYN
jgi:DNA-binding transcriptional regulator YdaS (Cro superfamily)